ncbi:hypothetical protein AB5I39_08820 [Sphingomonas sp. MMS24-J45]|uniref:hypothetical protein n=1 Tax=Sphingomonas sp. MMS24-J45 TaxID=3238806 RepID=UPI0038515B97
MQAFLKATLAALFICLAAPPCAATARPTPDAAAPIALDIAVQRDETVVVTYRAKAPIKALHFAQALGGYRPEDWHPQSAGFRWTQEGPGERIERVDGGTFRSVRFTLPVRYRALPKSYAPFSPFSDGSFLIHSGQFHACLRAPCEGTGAMPMRIAAAGKTIGVEGRRGPDQTRFVSRDEGTSIFVGTLKPEAADGFIAVIDPGLPPTAREHLRGSLPRAMDTFARFYGPLSFRPELYVSIDARVRADGHVSNQGGTLPGQIFMHFDGENARERVTAEQPFWLDWFFAHEAAHLFQQDRIGKLASDETAAWIHEGGADAMAALALARRGKEDRAYVASRVRSAETACVKGLTKAPLDRATADGNFDLHYQCGLLIWLALDESLRTANADGLHAVNKTLFARVKAGAPWDEAAFIAAAQSNGVPQPLLQRIARVVHGGYAGPQDDVAALGNAAVATVSRE